jgi:DNA-binding transcriptional LysR family regulator
MELRHLRYFVAVAEELHFRRAAARLHVAQPAVSEQVRKLEGELGVTLLDRGARAVSLTEAGAALLVEAKRVLHLADAAQHAARSASDRATGRLRVGYVASALPAAVPRALQALRASATRTEATLEPGSPLDQIEAVRAGYLDAAVLPLPGPTAGLRVTALDDQYAVAAVPLNDERARERTIGLERVAPERLLVLPREANRPFYDAIVAACREADLAPELAEARGDVVEQVLLAAASGAGMALVPACVAERYAAPGVRFVQLDHPRPAFATGVLTRRHSDHAPTAAFLRALGRIAEISHPTPTRGRHAGAVTGRAALELIAPGR